MRSGKKGLFSSYFFSPRTRPSSRSEIGDSMADTRFVISSPSDCQRVGHISYRAATGVFSNIQLLNLNTPLFFGAPISSQPRVEIAGYDDRLPSILILLVRLLISRNGLKTEGVFRVPADNESIQRAKYALNAGRGVFALETEEGPLVVASLIKDWFRSLPKALLSSISATEMKRLAELTGVSPREIYLQVLRQLPEPNRSIYRWIIELLSLVVAHSDENLMKSHGLAIVFSPSLFFQETATFQAFGAIGDVAKVIDRCIISQNEEDLVLREKVFAEMAPKPPPEKTPEKDEHPEWIRKIHPKTGDVYYEHKETGVTRWDKPENSPPTPTNEEPPQQDVPISSNNPQQIPIVPLPSETSQNASSYSPVSSPANSVSNLVRSYHIELQGQDEIEEKLDY